MFGTIIDLGRFIKTNFPEEDDPIFNPCAQGFSTTNTFMTVVDENPASLARVALMFTMLSDLRATRLSSQIPRAQLYAAIFYSFTSMVIPKYCHDM